MDYEKNLIDALANLLSKEAIIFNSWRGYRSRYQHAREYIDFLSQSKNLLTELDLLDLGERVRSTEVCKGMFIQITAAEEDKINALRSMAMDDYDDFKSSVAKRAKSLAVPEATRSVLMFAIQTTIDSRLLDDAEGCALPSLQRQVQETAFA